MYVIQHKYAAHLHWLSHSYDIEDFDVALTKFNAAKTKYPHINLRLISRSHYRGNPIIFRTHIPSLY